MHVEQASGVRGYFVPGRSCPGPTAKHPGALQLSGRARAASLIKYITLRSAHAQLPVRRTAALPVAIGPVRPPRAVRVLALRAPPEWPRPGPAPLPGRGAV